MIEEKTHIRETYKLNHRNDKLLHTGYDYENNLFSNLLSSILLSNNNLSVFLKLLEKQAIWLIDSTLPIRNFYNYTVSKYYNKHNN